MTILVAVFAAAMTVRAVILMVRDRTLSAVQIRYIEHKRLRLLEALASASWNRVAGLQHARVSSALTNDITRVAMTAHTVLQIAVALVLLAIQLLLTFLVSWRVGLVVLVTLAVGAAFGATRLGMARSYGEKLGRDHLALAHTTGQLLGGLKQATAEHRQGDFVRAFAATSDALVARQIAYQRRVTRLQFGLSTGTAIASAVVLLAGAWLEADRATLLATLVILFRMVAPATALQRDADVLAAAIPAHAAMAALTADLAPNDARSVAPTSRPTGRKGIVELRDVTYLHDGGGGVRNVSLSIASGEVVGVVGPSGAGKTTLIDLIAGLLSPQTGEIVTAANLSGEGQRDIAYLGQDTFLTGDTLRENLAGDGVDEPAMWTALATAAVADTVRAMPAGLDTRLAERGARLSGGERQRVAIARGLLRRPTLLILDEATNAIDVATEDRVLAALAALRPAPAIVLVAHRNEALRRCSRIITVDHGRVADDRAVA